jgi:hypothetical protein
MPRINPYKQAVNTRKLYDFEDEFFSRKHYKYLSKQISKKKLLELAEQIWVGEKIQKPFPEIRFGKGIHHNGDYVSWCNGPIVELASGQRDTVTLLHELAHGVGNYLHNHRFVDTYIHFLVKYGKVNKEELLDSMRTYHVDLPKQYKDL